jgi:hypothetical protein
VKTQFLGLLLAHRQSVAERKAGPCGCCFRPDIEGEKPHVTREERRTKLSEKGAITCVGGDRVRICSTEELGG